MYLAAGTTLDEMFGQIETILRNAGTMVAVIACSSSASAC